MNVQSVNREGGLLAEKKSRSFFNNKNGNMEVLEFLALISDEEQYRNYLGKHTTIRDKCPPFTLLEINTHCFFCVECFNGCKDKIKEYKTHYKYGNKKFTKEEVENWISESNSQETKSTEE